GVRRLEDVPQRTLGVSDLRLEEIALGEIRDVQAQTGANHPAGFVAGMTAVTVRRARRRYVIVGIHLMVSSHDLSRPPSLVKPQVANDMGLLEAAVGASTRGKTRAPADCGGATGDTARARKSARADAPDVLELCARGVGLMGIDNLRDAALFGRQ